MDKVVRRSSSRRPPADGEACYFPRDLSRGAFGGDVFCLQHFLKRQGALNEAPSGYFGEKTEKAVEKWQSREGILPSNGILAWTSRTRYAKVNGLPQPRPGVAAGASTSDGKERTCIDVCSEHSGVQVRLTQYAARAPARLVLFFPMRSTNNILPAELMHKHKTKT